MTPGRRRPRAPLDDLMAVLAALGHDPGWRCTALRIGKVTVRHPVHGERVCRVTGTGGVHVRGGVPAGAAADGDGRRDGTREGGG